MRYLTRAASGQIPVMFIMKLMMLELPNLVGLLLPLGFYVALLLIYGRLYAESEMTALYACGYSPLALLKDSLNPALVVTLFVFIVMFWASPNIAVERAKILKTTGVQTLIKTLIPGKFRETSKGKEAFYIEKINAGHTKADNIFLSRYKNNVWEIFISEKAFLNLDTSNHEEYVIFKNGKIYKGKPGEGDFELASFKDYKFRLPHPEFAVKEDVRALQTKDLLPFNNKDKRKAAELQWRLSIPLMVLALTFIAIPLSRVNTRSGKFARILPAIVIYILYANAMFILRNWVIAGKIPTYIGLWWLHVVIGLTGLYFILRSHKQVVSA